MKKTKRYEDGGFTFADVSDEERQAGIDAALADIDRRGVEQARELAAERAMGVEVGEEKPVKRAAPKAKAEAPRKEAKAEEKPAKREKFYPDLPRPKPAESAKAAMPNVAARKAATEERRAGSRSGKLGTQGVYGMKSGGMASRRADGCAVRGKTRGKMV